MDEDTGSQSESSEGGAEPDPLREQLAAREANERLLVARLREALAATDPAIDPSLVTGETLEDVERSFAAAKAMADRVREAVRREQALAIPPGAGLRAPVEPKTPFEKIRAGLGGH